MLEKMPTISPQKKIPDRKNRSGISLFYPQIYNQASALSTKPLLEGFRIIKINLTVASIQDMEKKIVSFLIFATAKLFSEKPIYAQAGLLTFGSSYRLRLPGQLTSDILQLSFPITAAGPSLIFTGFPIKLFYEHLNKI